MYFAQDTLLWRDKTCPARTKLIMSWKGIFFHHHCYYYHLYSYYYYYCAVLHFLLVMVQLFSFTDGGSNAKSLNHFAF